MIESIEGKRGIPRLRPPFVAEVGLFGRHTLEHNMETLHWVREIIEKGADWFTAHGLQGRSGLRSFSVSGRVKKSGMHPWQPAGITVNELIDKYCGGMLWVIMIFMRIPPVAHRVVSCLHLRETSLWILTPSMNTGALLDLQQSSYYPIMIILEMRRSTLCVFSNLNHTVNVRYVE